MKPVEDEVCASFYDKYGPEDELSRITGSPRLGMLNTGMQLFWLKYTKPAVFKRVVYSLHLPQYLSYLFTGIPVGEYTSIGCHTLLWNFEKHDYHEWVYHEGIDGKLPPITSATDTVTVNYKGRSIEVGPGIHDSSSALLPYIRSLTEPFLLVSTGTWSIAINPFNTRMLTLPDIANGSLFNMRIDGAPVKVSRLFLGNEYKLQVKALSDFFKVDMDYHKKVQFDQETFAEINKDFSHMFKWYSITSEVMPEQTQIPYARFEHAYHQLMVELVLLQVKSIMAAIGSDKIERLCIDGGFSDNSVFMHLLAKYVGKESLSTTNASLGSALGAALVISKGTLEPKFLEKNYALKKYRAFKAG